MDIIHATMGTDTDPTPLEAPTMTTTTVLTALDRIARLTPVRAAGSSRLTGEGVWVLTRPDELPAQFHRAQTERRTYYLNTPAHNNSRVPNVELATRAPRYVVTSYGVPIAWVTMDGRTHYGSDVDLMVPAPWFRDVQWLTARRHRDAIRAVWPERFALDSQGDPVINATGQLIRPDGLPAYRNHTPMRETSTV